MNMKSLLAAVVMMAAASALAADAPARKLTPAMGWSAWNAFHQDITIQAVVENIERFVALGLPEYGWQFINIDDCYQDGRDPVTGRLKVDVARFPGGAADLKAVADRAHAYGLKAGIYTDGGDNSCASGNTNPQGLGVGLLGHEEDDLNLFLGEGRWRDAWVRKHPEDPGVECWGFDFIKIDWCGGLHAKLDDREQYTRILDLIDGIERRTGRDKTVNLCRWAYVGPWQFRADSWRMGGDIDGSGDSWESVMVQVDLMKRLWLYTRPGSINDPDMLVCGRGNLTDAENLSHFAMWCMFSAPLMIGEDLRTIRPTTVELYKNRELIAINQDPAVLSAAYLGELEEGVEVWLKPLGDERSPVRALALFNRNAREVTVTFDYSLAGYTQATARDVIGHVDLPAAVARKVTLVPHGIDVVRLEPAGPEPVLGPVFGLRPPEASLHAAKIELGRRLDWANALLKVRRGAALVDTRSAAEFAAGHAEGAISLPHVEIAARAGTLLGDTNRVIVCYCRRGKRAAQAAEQLDMMGYGRVYFVGESFDAYAARPPVDERDVKWFLSDVHPPKWDVPYGVGKGRPDCAWDGEAIRLGGVEYAKGVGVVADALGGGSVVVSPVPAGAKYFVAIAGRDRGESFAPGATAGFEVQFDGRTAAVSAELDAHTERLFVVAVPPGAKEIKLLCRGGGKDNYCVWAGAGFTE